MRPLRVVVMLAGALPVWAWGPEGHRLISRIAETQLTPAAGARVAAILGPGRTLVSIGSWADEVRRSRPETGPWHYIDIPINQAHLDMERDCAKGNCVVAQIALERKAVEDPATAPDQRREALMFLVHFVGDMHEPLHCSDNHDNGGNGVRVVFFERQGNLHSLWDGGLLGRLPPEDQLFPELSRESARHARKWRNGTVIDWADQVHKAARKIVYGRLPKAPQGTPLPLGTDYERKSDPLVKEELEKAGVRLAAVLNETLK